MRPMRIWATTLLVVLSASAPAPMAAQTSDAKAAASDTNITPRTPAACLKAVEESEREAYRVAREAGQKFNFIESRKNRVTQARKCSAALDLATVDVSQYVELGSLYLMAGDQSKARETFEKLIVSPALTDSARASSVIQMIRAYGNAGNGDTVASRLGRNEAERLTSILDAIPGVAMQKVQAHGSLMGWYQDPGFEDIIDHHLNVVLEHVHKLSVAEQKESSYQILAAYRNLASRQANELRVDSAIAILNALRGRFPGVEDDVVKWYLEPELEFYRQVGQPAPKIHADYLINGPLPSLMGGVTIVTYTAHWCKPCKASYPGLKEIHASFAPKGLRLAFFVTLDGTFKEATTPEEEVEANRKYFVEENGFTFAPFAFQRSGFRAQMGEGEPPAEMENSKAYKIGSLPAFFVIDKKGIIRGALRDWSLDGTQQRSLTTLVQRLLAEE